MLDYGNFTSKWPKKCQNKSFWFVARRQKEWMNESEAKLSGRAFQNPDHRGGGGGGVWK